MALGTAPATVGTALLNLITAVDPNGNVSFAHALLDANGASVGTSANPLYFSENAPLLTFAANPTATSSLVLKNTAGSFYSAYVTTGSTAGYLMMFDANTVPADGTVTPKEAIYCPANSTTNVDYSATPQAFTTGIVIVFSSSGPFTKTASATAFIKGAVA